MTDNDIIKALEHCTSSTTSEACNGCPLFSTTICTEMENGLRIYALGLINRQKAEIEQWKEEANKYQNLWCQAVMDVQAAKSEAIKEFAESVKKNRRAILNAIYDRTEYSNIVDNLVKEMTEEKE